MKFGIHAGPQNLTMDELKRLWRTADTRGFHWVSVWDHFYANPLERREDPCFEAVAAMAALAALTENVRVGCLVFCALFRNPAVLAKAADTSTFPRHDLWCARQQRTRAHVLMRVPGTVPRICSLPRSTIVLRRLC